MEEERQRIRALVARSPEQQAWLAADDAWLGSDPRPPRPLPPPEASELESTSPLHCARTRLRRWRVVWFKRQTKGGGWVWDWGLVAYP